VVAAAAVAASGCGFPFGPCFSERIEVTLAGESNGAALQASDGVSPGNISDFSTLRDFLIDGQSLPGRTVAWTVSLSDGYLAVMMPGSVSANQTITLTAFRGGGWGAPAGTGSVARVSWVDAGFEAATVTGILVVRAVAPLRVELTLTARDAANATRQLAATATFAYHRDRSVCD
jgi:hypothetical protein